MSAAGEGLWQQIARPGPLRAAFRRAFRGNRRNPEACRFHLELEPNVLALCDDLEHRRYAPDPYRFFHIRQPKRRLISVASFRDRVVHHALVAALEPLFEPRFIRHSYACRRGKGTHRALGQARRWARAFSYYLKTDVDDYFACIDHRVLLDLLAAAVTDGRVLWLCERVVANARLPTVPPGQRRGLPIGNLTSQFWANVYLDPLDHFLRDDLHRGACLRYMDDVLVFDHDKARLWEVLSEARSFARHRLKLRFKDTVTRVAPVVDGISFLGMRVHRGMIRLDGSSAARLARSVRKVEALHRRGIISPEECAQRLTSLAAHADHVSARSFVRGVVGDLAPVPADLP